MTINIHPGKIQRSYSGALAHLHAGQILKRIWARDHTVWEDNPEEISNRLGWLDCPTNMENEIAAINEVVNEIRSDGYTHALLLGMGGSSLAPDVFRRIFGIKKGYLEMAILDSTDPNSIHDQESRVDLSKCLFIVSTKSGGTIETLSLFKYFYNRVSQIVGNENAGNHFIAITDPGSSLEKLANEKGFRKTFLNDPNIGGRYSALSFFGLLPAALIGIDIQRLLESAQRSAKGNNANIATTASNAARLGAFIGGGANLKNNKLTLIFSEKLNPFGDWVEQLIAESTGKFGRGVLPVLNEPLSTPDRYGDDRLFLGVALENEGAQVTEQINELAAQGFPTAQIIIKDLHDLGAQFFEWELATAIAGHTMGIHPFDQPNVESAKVMANELVAQYEKSGALPKTSRKHIDSNELADFIMSVAPGGYFGIQAFVNPTTAMEESLEALRLAIWERSGVPVTIGYGPRFLHSTGQLHKGDSGKGMFIQIVSISEFDLQIPDDAGKDGSSTSFEILKHAQAAGDAQALINESRKVLSFSLAEGDAQAVLDLAMEIKAK